MNNETGDRFLTNLAAAVRIRTITHDDHPPDASRFEELHSLFETAYPLVHTHCRVEQINELSLLITWQGSDVSLDPLLLMAHQDVVPVEPGTEAEWPVGPFSGEIADGYLWGRGSLDDKGPLIAILEAVEHLLATGFSPQRTVILAFGHDEEGHGVDGAVQVATTLRERGVTPWMLLDEGGGVADSLPGITSEPVALVRTGEKGTLTLKLTARGEDGHSSAPRRPTTIGKLANALKKLEDSPPPSRLEVIQPTFDALEPRLSGPLRILLGNSRRIGPVVSRLLSREPALEALIRTTTAITRVSGGNKDNAIPSEASAVVNFRIIPGDTVESTIAHVVKTVGSDIEVEVRGSHSEPSQVSSASGEAWKTLAATVEEVFQDAIVAPWTLIAVTDARHFQDIAADSYGFMPFTLGFEDFSRLHGTGERIRASDAESAVRFFVRLIERACG